VTVPAAARDQEGEASELASPSCFRPWSLPRTKLKDHTVFRYGDDYFVAAIQVHPPAPDGRGEYYFAYARTSDFCSWDNLGTILGPGAPGDADESYIWAPHVVEHAGTYYMFYTGVNRNIAQTIMLATTTNPLDPESWVKQGEIFRPDHPGMVYSGPESWSDARDPMVLPYNGRFYLFYTGRDVDGGIVGVAMADSLMGPWRDLGAIVQTPPSIIPESPFVFSHDGYFYLYYNASGVGHTIERWHWAPSPFGPWQPAADEYLGWAHEFFRVDGSWYASYIIGDSTAIGVSPVQWHGESMPTIPVIGWHVALPFVLNP
jgi:beta-xylosidase